MLLRNMHRKLSMNQIGENLRCETEEHNSAEAASNERRRHKKIKTASNIRLKRNACIPIQLETCSTERYQKKCIETGTKMEPDH